MYTEAGVHYTPARAKNAKAKAVEPFNHYFNMEYCRYHHNWTGHNMTASKKNQPNQDILTQYRADFPDAEGCRRQIEEFIARDRAKRIDAYRAAWANTPEERKELLSDEMYLHLFGDTTGHRGQLQPDGLRVTIGGELFKFECFDRRFREHSAVRWEVKYDTTDLSKVLAENEDGTLRFMLEKKYIQPMALADRKEGDAAQLQRVFDFNEIELKQVNIEKFAKAYTDVDDLFANYPQLKNDTLYKFVLPDSRGQYKDRLHELRTGRMQAQVIDVTAVEEDDDYEEVIFDERELRKQY
jgi:hypothetical protein